jgi:hypothetical protein
MTTKETDELIRDYVKRGSEEAFKELVNHRRIVRFSNYAAVFI